MKKIVLLLLSAQAGIALSQGIPNPYFEGWNSRSTDAPKFWTTAGTVSKVAGAKSGFAMRLENKTSDGSVGMCFQAREDTNRFLNYGPGFAFSGTPDSMVITYRADLKQDTAYLTLSFTKAGENFPVTFDFIELYTTNGTWKTLTLPLTYTGILDSMVADSGLFYLMSADNILGPYSNGYIEIDNLSFINKNHTSPSTMPNQDFEMWDHYAIEQPDGWGTAALFLANSGLNLNYTNKTSDHYSGNWAIKLQASVVTWPLTLSKDTLPGFALTMKDLSMKSFLNADVETPSFAVNQRYSSVRGYVKSSLLKQDQSILMINFFKADSIVGSAVWKDTTSHSNWTRFSEDIAWDSAFSGTPDSATIMLLVSDSSQERIGSMQSWAIFDDLQLDNYFTSVKTKIAEPILASCWPNPTRGELNIRWLSAAEENATILVQELNGKIIQEIAVHAEKGANQSQLKLNGSVPAIYVVSLTQNGKTLSQKICYTP